jgi:hypothetical protein
MGSAQVCSAWSDPASRRRSRRAVDHAQPQCDERLSICRRRSRHRSSRRAGAAPKALRRRQSARVVQFASFNLFRWLPILIIMRFRVKMNLQPFEGTSLFSINKDRHRVSAPFSWSSGSVTAPAQLAGVRFAHSAQRNGANRYDPSQPMEE